MTDKTSIQFTHPPQAYRAESESYSKFWFCWLPLLSIPAFFLFANLFPAFSQKWLVSEQTGLLEFMNALFPLITAGIGVRLLFFKSVRRDSFLVLWCVALVVGGIYLGGEEASWGQHYIGWTTTEFWSGLNDQQETNLHNISHWFDQKPRLILTIGIYVSALIEPWLHLYRPNLLWRRFDFIYPALALVPLAVCVLVANLLGNSPNALFNILYGPLRAGEMQEVYIVWFLLAYALSLLWRAKSLEASSN